MAFQNHYKLNNSWHRQESLKLQFHANQNVKEAEDDLPIMWTVEMIISASVSGLGIWENPHGKRFFPGITYLSV